MREALGAATDAAKRFVVRLVRGGASGAAIDDRANGNVQRLLGDVLMNRVVGEASERVGSRVDFNFGFVRVAEFQDSLGEAFEIGLREASSLGCCVSIFSWMRA